MTQLEIVIKRLADQLAKNQDAEFADDLDGEEETEDVFAHRYNSGYCGKCWNGICQYDDDGNFVG